MHPLENIVQAFQNVLIEKARLKTELACQPDLPAELPDRSRFEQGVPLLLQTEPTSFPEDWWQRAAERLLPAMQQGFPKLQDDLRTIEQSLHSRRLSLEQTLEAALQNRADRLAEIISDLGTYPQTFHFALGQLMKPLVEKRAEALAPLIHELPWHKGYCPVCGSMPELAFLKGVHGQRWLRCALCAHHWRFLRLACPFCDNDDPETLIVYFVVGREQERVEACQECNRYVICLDLRSGFDETILDVAALGLVHLDVLTQEKGFSPAAACAWNIVSREDISSMPLASVEAISVI
jgi:FdhE protein